MRILPFTVLLAPLALAGCGRAAVNNMANTANVVAEEGIEDVNSSIEGDQLSPDIEAVDDLATNGVVRNSATMPTPPPPPRS